MEKSEWSLGHLSLLQHKKSAPAFLNSSVTQDNSMMFADRETGPKRVLIATDANKDVSDQCLSWCLENLINAGDFITVLGILHRVRTPLGYESEANLTAFIGTNKFTLELEMNKKLLHFENKLRKLSDICDKKGIPLDISITAGTPLKSVLVKEVSKRKMTHVILDRIMGRHKRYYKENIDCCVIAISEKGKAEYIREGSDLLNNDYLCQKFETLSSIATPSPRYSTATSFSCGTSVPYSARSSCADMGTSLNDEHLASFNSPYKGHPDKNQVNNLHNHGTQYSSQTFKVSSPRYSTTTSFTCDASIPISVRSSFSGDTESVMQSFIPEVKQQLISVESTEQDGPHGDGEITLFPLDTHSSHSHASSSSLRSTQSSYIDLVMLQSSDGILPVWSSPNRNGNSTLNGCDASMIEDNRDGVEVSMHSLVPSGQPEQTEECAKNKTREAVINSKGGPSQCPPICFICNMKSPYFGYSVKIFSWYELQIATNHFGEKNLIAEDKFGSAYKGIFKGGDTVTVWKLSYLDPQQYSYFISQIETWNFAHHRNIVGFLGFCADTNGFALVYEYVCCGSLDEHLRGCFYNVLMWSSRYKIAVGVARGLRYLHEECRVGSVSHGDIRSKNILLTHEFTPMIGAFGLAGLLPDIQVDSKDISLERYLAPEYIIRKSVTLKTDVYAFGVVLLELVCGPRFINSEQSMSAISLKDWATSELQRETIHKLVDPKLLGLYDICELNKMMKAALLCLTENPLNRPGISEVLHIFEGDVNDSSLKILHLQELSSCEKPTHSQQFGEIRPYLSKDSKNEHARVDKCPGNVVTTNECHKHVTTRRASRGWKNWVKTG